MDERTWRPTAVPRLLAICALLLAVFAMHGPAAATGCHGTMPVTDAMAATGTVPLSSTMPGAMPVTGPLAASAQYAGGPAATAPRPAAVRAASLGGAGASCVSTLLRGTASLHQLPSLVWVLTLLAAAAAVRPGPPGAAGTRRRGPPGAGRELLLQACIART